MTFLGAKFKNFDFFRHSFGLALGVAIVFRLVVFGVTSKFPVVADSGNLISPSIAFGTDIAFYKNQMTLLLSQSIKDVVWEYLRMSPETRGMLAGPVFPLLLHLFKYENGNSWPLAVVFLTGSIGLVAFWLRWLWQKEVPFVWLIVFAILPNPVFYMICVGTELPFCLLFSGFFYFYFKDTPRTRDTFCWVVFLFLSLLTRPNAVAILIFVIVDQYIKSKGQVIRRSFYITEVFLSMFALFAFGGFFYPYFISVSELAYTFSYFNVPIYAYWDGLFHFLPGGLDKLVSLGALFVAKVLYFMGLRPSYSDVSPLYVLVRSLPGFILLPGTIYLFMQGEFRHRLLGAFFIIPILMVAAQDRYNLPIQPILFYYGYKFYSRVFPVLGV